MRNFVRIFPQSAGALLLGLAVAMFIGNWDSAGIMQPHDPGFMVSMRTLFWAVAFVELTVGLLCLGETRVWLKLSLVLWLALNIGVYQVGVRWSGLTHDFSVYLGTLARAFGLTPRFTYWILNLVYLYLFIGSSASLMWLWVRSRNHLKMACGQCGGHIEFHVRGIGQRTACPHCAAEITLHAPPEGTSSNAESASSLAKTTSNSLPTLSGKESPTRTGR
jgi:hypothetical protein